MCKFMVFSVFSLVFNAFYLLFTRFEPICHVPHTCPIFPKHRRSTATMQAAYRYAAVDRM